MHTQITNESEREDLLQVEYLIENYPPVFTAAGFFQLNQRLFSSFCSVVVTYIIVIFQYISGNMESNSVQTNDVPEVNLSLETT